MSDDSLEQRIQELEHENADLKQEIAALKKFKAIDTCFDSVPGEYEGAINQIVEKEKQLLFAAVEQIPKMVYITNSEGIIQYLNPAFERLTGFTRQECIGKAITTFRSRKHDSQFNINLRAMISSGREWNGHAEFKKKDNSFDIVKLTISSVRDQNGTITNFVGVQQNVSKEMGSREKTAQVQKLESLGTIAGGVAHDLNNMLFPILGNAEILILRSKAYDNETKESLTQIYESALQAKELVQQILNFSRQKKVKRAPLQIQNSIDTVLKLMDSGIPRNISIKKEIYPDCPSVIADPTQINQIIMNLVSNSVHAVGKTGGVIKFSLAPVNVSQSEGSGRVKPGDYICLSVSDTGKGMSKEVMSHIFEPFFTTKGNEDGTGMGLSVVYGIVKDMGGGIKVHSRPDKGSEFRLYFPKFSQKKVESQGHTPTLKASAGIKYQINVLFVDDEDLILKVAKSLLNRLGCRTTIMTDPLVALARFKKNPLIYDLVITDLYMPHMNGDCLAEQIRELRPNIPIFLCTGFNQDITLDMMRQTGFKAVLAKPLSIKEFVDKIGKFFKPETPVH